MSLCALLLRAVFCPFLFTAVLSEAVPFLPLRHFLFPPLTLSWAVSVERSYIHYQVDYSCYINHSVGKLQELSEFYPSAYS